ncbi:hypothetical protein WKH24_06515 [Pantoea agglomerans]|uniref:hypothetical protein n=1 Tax=Enterobacter agglomerans TaxID=549 RepID=UPI003C7B8A05
MKLRKLTKFYGMLTLLYFSDMVVLVGLIWNTYKVTHSPYFLGGVLSASVLIPFITRRFFVTINLLHLNFSQLFTFRMIAYLSIAATAMFNFSSGYAGTALIIILYGLLTLSTLSTFEAGNFKLVRAGHITSVNSSRLLQTVIQTGAFAGALLSGLLLDTYTFNRIILFISVFDIAMSCIGYFLMADLPGLYEKPEVKSASTRAHPSSSIQPQQKMLILLMGVIGLHISSFNILTPAIYQSLNHWGSEQFGIASGAACFGAFLAAAVTSKKERYPLYAILLVLSDAIFCYIEIQSVNVVSCFFLGLFLNLVRIGLRTEMIDSITEQQSEEAVAAHVTTAYSVCQAAGPIIMALLISETMMGINAARWLLPAVATILLTGILILSFLKRNMRAADSQLHSDFSTRKSKSS